MKTDVEGLREDLRLLVDELRGMGNTYWRDVRKLAIELDSALYNAQRMRRSWGNHGGVAPTDLGVSVSDGVQTGEKVG